MIDRQTIRKNRWFIALVVVPTIISAFYYLFIASDRYVSESRFVVKNASQRAPQISSIANLIQTTGLSPGQEQTNEVIDYIKSRDALEALSKNGNLRANFGIAQADFLSRYPAPFVRDNFESLYRYYDHMVTVRMDPNTGLAVLLVNAYTGQGARDINAQLLDLSEALVNRLNEKARNNAIAENEKLVAIAEQRVKTAGIQLAIYRNRNALLDPTTQASGVFDVATRLIAQRAALQSQLDVMRQLTPDNPAITSIEKQIAALSAQVNAQTRAAVGPGSAISSKLPNYEGLVLEQQFAAQMLTAANTQLAQSHAEAAQQQFYLERVVSPNIADDAEYPHRFTQILIIAGVLLSLYLIGWMLVVGILEHAPED
jgi:capsular polysaccharide transport system permease protein